MQFLFGGPFPAGVRGCLSRTLKLSEFGAVLRRLWSRKAVADGKLPWYLSPRVRRRSKTFPPHQNSINLALSRNLLQPSALAASRSLPSSQPSADYHSLPQPSAPSHTLPRPPASSTPLNQLSRQPFPSIQSSRRPLPATGTIPPPPATKLPHSSDTAALLYK